MGLARVPAMMGGTLKLVEKSITLDGNNETKSHNLFQLTEDVLIHALWGEVTTALGSNLTTCLTRLESSGGESPQNIGGTNTCSSLIVGSGLYWGENSFLLSSLTVNTPALRQPSNSSSAMMRYPFVVLKADRSNTTYVVFRYTTTNTPTSGVIKFRAWFEKTTANGNLVAV